MKLLTTHTGADFDALASLLGASKLYPDCLLFLPGSPEKSVRRFLKDHGYPGKLSDFSEIKNENIDLLVIVDTRFKNRIGRVKDLINENTEIHLYDHHPRTKDDLKGTVDVKKSYGATTTLLLEKIMQKNINLAPDEATLLTMGIYEDTGCLTYSITSPKDLIAVSYLLENKADLSKVSDYVIHVMNEEQVHLLNKMLKNKNQVEISKTKIIFIQAEIQEYIEDLSVVVHKAMDILKPHIIFALIKIKSGVICIARSKSRKLDVGKILSVFGGGGHPTAASANFSSKDNFLSIRKKITHQVEKYIHNLDTNIKITKKPPRLIPVSHNAERAFHALAHLDMEYAPVGDDKGNLYGVVQREELQKALRHGLSEKKVEEFISDQIPSIQESAENKEIESKLDSSAFPVINLIRDGKIIGIAEKKEGKSESEISIQPRFEFVNSKFENNLNSKVLALLKRAGAIADSMGIKLYCVGGMVRDILMDIKHKDIDIVAEKNGIEFAEKLSRELGGHLSTHKKFKTAVLKLKDREIDIATLRKEYYEFPGALPDVATGSLKQDLYRRDFTINAMAIQLNPKQEYGKLIDYFGSKEDLDKGIIRILYPLSFIEDPTRIFRAIRFEQRFGFRLSKKTLAQLKRTVSMDIHSQVTNDRVRDEIILIMNENNPHDILKRLDHLGALTCIHKDLRITDTIYKNIEIFLKNEPEYAEKIKNRMQYKRWNVLILILLSQLDIQTGLKVLKSFHFPKDFMSKYIQMKNYEKKVIKILKKPLTRARIFKSLHILKEEVILYILITCRQDEVKKKIIEYMTDIEKININLTGGDLIDMGLKPGPIFSKILYTLKIAKIDGRINTPQQEKEFVSEQFSNPKSNKRHFR
ncbi:MAG: DHHA1 domain-containing protein [Elusimicrobiota bacterium]